MERRPGPIAPAGQPGREQVGGEPPAAGLNPYLTASADVADLPYGALLGAEGWTAAHGPTPYGPLWTHLEQLAYFGQPGAGGGRTAGAQSVALAASLGSGWGPLPRAAAGWAAIAVGALAVLPVYWPWYAGLAVAVLLLRPTAVALAFRAQRSARASAPG